MSPYDPPVDPTMPGLSPSERRLPTPRLWRLDEGASPRPAERRRNRLLHRALARLDRDLLSDLGLSQRSG